MLYATGLKPVQLNTYTPARLLKSSRPVIEKSSEKERCMKIASIKPNDLAIIKNEQMIPLGGALPVGLTMVDLIAGYDNFKASLESASATARAVTLDAK